MLFPTLLLFIIPATIQTQQQYGVGRHYQQASHLSQVYFRPGESQPLTGAQAQRARYVDRQIIRQLQQQQEPSQTLHRQSRTYEGSRFPSYPAVAQTSEFQTSNVQEVQWIRQRQPSGEESKGYPQRLVQTTPWPPPNNDKGYPSERLIRTTPLPPPPPTTTQGSMKGYPAPAPPQALPLVRPPPSQGTSKGYPAPSPPALPLIRPPSLPPSQGTSKGYPAPAPPQSLPLVRPPPSQGTSKGYPAPYSPAEALVYTTPRSPQGNFKGYPNNQRLVRTTPRSSKGFSQNSNSVQSSYQYGDQRSSYNQRFQGRQQGDTAQVQEFGPIYQGRYARDMPFTQSYQVSGWNDPEYNQVVYANQIPIDYEATARNPQLGWGGRSTGRYEVVRQANNEVLPIQTGSLMENVANGKRNQGFMLYGTFQRSNDPQPSRRRTY